jgi:rsbT co-antagonist protein RsbR
MNHDNLLILRSLLDAQEDALLAAWTKRLKLVEGTGRIAAVDLDSQTRQVLTALKRGLVGGDGDPNGPEFAALREILTGISGSRAVHGFSPGETATFVFSLKQPLIDAVRVSLGDDPGKFAAISWDVTQLVDQLGIFTFEVFQKTREEVILRQQREIAELSTPVVKLWDRVLALPLIGTLDSERTQVVMENLLQSIVDEGAEIAIIDITGVPTVDTLVAQHLLKTVAAARLMGADCIVSGIRPQIAQTMVHLGVELNVVSKASLADAFAVALARTGKVVVSQKAKA